MLACAKGSFRARSLAVPELARLFPRLPSVERVLATPAAASLLEVYSREAVLAAVRDALEALRVRIRGGAELAEAELSAAAVATAAEAILEERSRARTRTVVNATGVVLHTNLGRALLADSAARSVVRAATGAVALEYDVDAGRRGERDRLVEEHLTVLAGAEAATVVNNNAAAVFLVLNTLADGREVVVSRGELIEIGGSFRIPEIMAKSGAVLKEVGTTNRTHVADYEDAIGPDTGLLLKVHTSNYRIVGFTASVDVAELAIIAARHDGLGVVEDLGAGALVDLSRWGLLPEPVVSERIAAGADLVTFSGDKLLGGPQCGLIVGRRDLVERVRQNPLKRALRCDKMTLAALEETLRIYRFDRQPERSIPTLRALVRPIDELERIGRHAAELLAAALGADCEVALVVSQCQVGSGAQPAAAIESRALAVTSASCSADELAVRFRGARTPIIGRIENDRFLLDLRTVERAKDLVPELS